ncbi:MAG: hypothetical protein U1E45_19370 [Geminicoccaceae bacterium]
MRNPFLSMWLTEANRWTSVGRGLWSAEMQRQQTRIISEMTKQAVAFWTWPMQGLMPAPVRKRDDRR